MMDPIGASADWDWDGYDGADIHVEGRALRCVSGGGHWGGGLFIGSRDNARLGALVLADGVWAGRRILPAGWVATMTAPSPRNPGYGCLWWRNGGAVLPQRARRQRLRARRRYEPDLDRTVP